MTTITDPKVVILTIFQNYWAETAIPNLPANVKFVSAIYDQAASMQNQVVVGDLTATEDEWISGKDKLFKGIVDIHTYTRIIEPNTSNMDMGTLKKQRQAMNENIRTIQIKHPDRPVADIMHIFPRTRAVDRDLRTERGVVLHSVQQSEVWYVEAYP